MSASDLVGGAPSPPYLARWFRCGLIAIALTVGCGEEDPVDADGGRALLERVQSEGYRQWRRAPGWDSRLPSIGGGHGGQLDIYVNEAIASLLDSGMSVAALPVGSTIVKDVWNGAELHAIAIMDKREDGWYWAEYRASGEVLAAGHPHGCIACHQRGADYVRAFIVP